MSGSSTIIGPSQASLKKPDPPPPAPFKITPSTKLEDWKKWQISFRYYANAIHLEQKSHDVQLSTFKSMIGPDALKIYNTFSILDITDVESVMRKFDDHFKPKVNVTLERYNLYKLCQKSGQKFDDFLADITNQVEKCDFQSMRDEIILYKIVGGIESDEVRNALLSDAELKYDKAVQICRASSAMHFMSGKENVRKGRTKNVVELDKALEVVLTEGHAKKNRKLGSETKVNKTTKFVSKQKPVALRSKRSSSEEPLRENVSQKQSDSRKLEKPGPSKEEFLKETVSLQPAVPAENDTKVFGTISLLSDSEQEEEFSSDGGDGDWRAVDDRWDGDEDEKGWLKKVKEVNIKKASNNEKKKKKKRNQKQKKSNAGEKCVKQNRPCNICNKIIGTELQLERHRSIHVRGEKASCHYCGREFKYSSLKRHMAALHYDVLGWAPPKLFCCEFCDFITRFPLNLERHIYQHTGEKPLACEHCEYKCIRPRLMKAHMAKVHTGVRPFSCSVCKRGFLHSDALKAHMKIHMTPEEKQKYLESLKSHTMCETCGKVFTSKAVLKIHSRIHTGEKPFACHVCEYRGTSIGSLNAHLVKHSDEKPFICAACGYSCKKQQMLQRHMLTHTGEKAFSCETCGKKFSQTTHLKRHRITHTGERPHVCEICAHGSATKTELRLHMKVHEKQSGAPSQHTPPHKRRKKPQITVVGQSADAAGVQAAVAEESEESDQCECDAAAEVIIQWSEQVPSVTTSDYVNYYY